MRVALVSLALFAACYSPGYRDCEVTCATSQACPNGFQCSASGFCVTSSGTSCGTGPDGGGSDGSMGDGGGGDAAGLGPWGMAMPVPFVAGTPMGLDDHPSLTDDMRYLFVHRAAGNPPTHDIFGASRSSTMAPFSSPAFINTISSTSSSDTTPELAPTGLEVYFASNRGGAATLDIFYSNRPTQADTFSIPTAVPGINSAADDASPAISRDGKTIVWASSRSGIVDLYIATRPSTTSAWSTPMEMTMLNDPAYRDDAPFLSTDKLTIYFSSNRGPGGDFNLYTATRQTDTSMFGPPSAIMELNTPNAYDGDPWVSPDGRTIYFTRAIAGTLTLMYATR